MPVLILVAVLISGCSALDPISIKRAQMGYKPYDPCIKCGETWQQLPNWQHEAIVRRSRGETW